MKTVIMAGGRGIRISSVASDISKPMIKIGGVPVLEHEVQGLQEQRYTDIILTVSHLGEKIVEYFGDGARFEVRIEYFEETPNLIAAIVKSNITRKDFIAEQTFKIRQSSIQGAEMIIYEHSLYVGSMFKESRVMNGLEWFKQKSKKSCKMV